MLRARHDLVATSYEVARGTCLPDWDADPTVAHLDAASRTCRDDAACQVALLPPSGDTSRSRPPLSPACALPWPPSRSSSPSPGASPRWESQAIGQSCGRARARCMRSKAFCRVANALRDSA